MEVNFDDETMAKIKELSEEANLSPEGFVECVIMQFALNKGSRVYTGRWSGGVVDDVKGFRYVVQWPFRPGFFEATGDIVKKWRMD
jgi:hypothetical protein